MGLFIEVVLTISSNGFALQDKMAAMPIYGKNTSKPSSSEPRKLWGWILIYPFGDARSTNFVQMMILGWSLSLLLHCQISVQVAVAILEECCMAFIDMQWLFNSGERIVTHGYLVYICSAKTPMLMVLVGRGGGWGACAALHKLQCCHMQNFNETETLTFVILWVQQGNFIDFIGTKALRMNTHNIYLWRFNKIICINLS